MKKTLKIVGILAGTWLGVSGISMTALAPMQAVQAVDQKAVRMSLGASLNAQQEAEVRQLLGGNQVSAANTLRLDGNLLNHYLGDGSNQSTGVYSSAIIVPQPAGYGVQIQIMTPSKITQVAATTYQNAAITSGARDVLIRIATPFEVTGEGALAGVYALLEQAGVKVSPTVVNVSQKEITIINHIVKIYHINNIQVNNLFADIKLEVNNYFIQHNQVILDNDINVVINRIAEKYGLNLEDRETIDAIREFIKSYAGTDIAKSPDTVTQINQSILTKAWDAQLAGMSEVLNRDALLQQTKQDYSDTALYHPVIQSLYQTVLAGIEQELDSATMKTYYGHSFIIEKMLGVATEQERQALNYIRTLLYHYVASKEDGQLPSLIGKDPRVIYGTTRENWLEYLRRYRSLEQDTVLREVVDQVGLVAGVPMEATYYGEINQVGDWVVLNYTGYDTANAQPVSLAYNPQTKMFGHIQGEHTDQAIEPTDQTALPTSLEFYGIPVENKRLPITEIPDTYTVSANSEAYTNGTEHVAGEAVYQINPIVAGQAEIDFIVGPGETYKLHVGNLATDETQAGETGSEHLTLEDTSMITEGTPVTLFIKNGEQWEEKATVIVESAGDESATDTTTVEQVTPSVTEGESSEEDQSSQAETVAETTTESMGDTTVAITETATSAVWPETSQQALSDFIAQWQVGLGQTYTRVAAGQAYPYGAVDLLAAIEQQSTVEGQPVKLVWHHQMPLTNDSTTGYIFDVYTDNQHVYVFAYYQGQVYALHAETLNAQNGFDFKVTANDALKQAFAQIAGQTLPEATQQPTGTDTSEDQEVEAGEAPYAVPSELIVGQLLFKLEGMNIPTEISVEIANPNRIVLYYDGQVMAEADVHIKNVATKRIRVFSAEDHSVREVQVNTKIIIDQIKQANMEFEKTFEFYMFLNKNQGLSLATPNFAGNVEADMKDVMLEYLKK